MKQHNVFNGLNNALPFIRVSSLPWLKSAMTFYNATHYYNILLFFSQNLDHTRCQLPIVLPEKWFSNIQICFSSATNKIILIQSQAIYRILYAVQQLAMNDISINNKHLFLLFFCTEIMLTFCGSNSFILKNRIIFFWANKMNKTI